MALEPKRIYTRRIAMIEEAGFTADDVPEDGFHEDGFDVVITGPGGQIHVTASNEVATKRIEWPDDSTRRRARDAMDGDFAETIGMTTEEWRTEEARLKYGR